VSENKNMMKIGWGGYFQIRDVLGGKNPTTNPEI